MLQFGNYETKLSFRLDRDGDVRVMLVVDYSEREYLLNASEINDIIAFLNVARKRVIKREWFDEA
jgi:hypothetical protein